MEGLNNTISIKEGKFRVNKKCVLLQAEMEGKGEMFSN